MRCCIQNCLNDDAKKTNKNHGITCHKLPKHPETSAAWLEALIRLGYRKSSKLVVCSAHFLPEDFDDTRPNQRRIKCGAVPTIKAPVIQEELKVCIVCLAVDVKMYNMKDFKLSEMFHNITGILAVDKKGGILPRVCWECAARLAAAAAFRDKALLSDALLKDHEHITKCDIATLKKERPSLNSPLTVQTVFSASEIECVQTTLISDNEEIHNISVLNDKKVVKEEKSTKTNKQKDIGFEKHKLCITSSENKDIDNMFILNDRTGLKEKKYQEKDVKFIEEEPWIDIPVKTEIEPDPIADNNMRYPDPKSDILLEPTHFNNTSSRDNSDDETTNAEVTINNNDDKIFREATLKVPTIKNGIISLEEHYIETKPELGGIGNIIDESISEEDAGCLADEVSVSNEMKNMRNKFQTINEKTRNRRNRPSLKGKIIALKKQGLSVTEIAKKTGASITSIFVWLHNNDFNDNTYHRKTSLKSLQTIIETDSEMGNCSSTVKRRLHRVGLEHILKSKKPEGIGTTEQKISKHKALHDNIKERIIALKEEGLSNIRVAYLLNISRMTVSKWWNRWCNEGHMRNGKQTGRKRKTTAEEDQLLIERVTKEPVIHTPSLAKEFGVSSPVMRRRIREAGFRIKKNKASEPLRSGRNHKVDKETKQQIIMMKNDGVSVTDIANQFRVTRTSVYLWWRRWCKENNIKITNDSEKHTIMTGEGRSLAVNTSVENIAQTHTILSSMKSLWQKPPDLEFVS